MRHRVRDGIRRRMWSQHVRCCLSAAGGLGLTRRDSDYTPLYQLPVAPFARDYLGARSGPQLNPPSLLTCLHTETPRVSIKGDGVSAAPTPSNSTTTPLRIRMLAGDNRSGLNMTSGVSSSDIATTIVRAVPTSSLDMTVPFSRGSMVCERFALNQSRPSLAVRAFFTLSQSLNCLSSKLPGCC
jgi:hypothetical protein